MAKKPRKRVNEEEEDDLQKVEETTSLEKSTEEDIEYEDFSEDIKTNS